MSSDTEKEIVDLRNPDLSLEYTSCIQYSQNQAVLKGALHQNIQKEQIIHAQKELAQAVLLANQIDRLEGEPVVDMVPAQAWSLKRPLPFPRWFAKICSSRNIGKAA